jgi:hypothetical protein
VHASRRIPFLAARGRLQYHEAIPLSTGGFVRLVGEEALALDFRDAAFAITQLTCVAARDNWYADFDTSRTSH